MDLLQLLHQLRLLFFPSSVCFRHPAGGKREAQLTFWMMTSSNAPQRCADTPSHSLQVSNTQHQHQPLYHTHTHTEPHHPAAKTERKRESQTPTCPCGVGVPVGKSQVKTVAHDGSVSGSQGQVLLSLPAPPARPRSASVSGVGVSVAAQRRDDAERARERGAKELLLPRSGPQRVKETLSPVNTDLQRSTLT